MFILLYFAIKLIFKTCFLMVGLVITMFLLVPALAFSLTGNRRTARDIMRQSPVRMIRRLYY